jgi:outer membrane protein OmpA-like peptidoglycan-associated protein
MSKAQRVIRFAALASVASITALSLAGCSFGATLADCDPRVGAVPLSAEREVAVILAPTSNFVDFEKVLIEVGPRISDLLTQDKTSLNVVLADSTPSIVAKYSVDFSDAPFQSDRDEVIEIAQGRLSWAVNCASGLEGVGFSVDPEVDFLRALGVASESFVSSSSEKFVFILGNGLQTSGQFSFLTGFPEDSRAADKLVDQLQTSGAIKPLNGAKVFWTGLGQVNTGHPVLNQQSIDSLVSLWTNIVLTADGGVGSIAAGNVTEGSPSIGAIPVGDVSGLEDACVSLTLGADKGFSFRPDSTEFLDVALASEGARAVASEIENSDCTGSVKVTGFTASGTNQKDYLSESSNLQLLSLQRAEAFAQLLRDAGLKGKIEVIGAGKGPINDWDENGNFVEELGAQNRKVVVVQN